MDEHNQPSDSQSKNDQKAVELPADRGCGPRCGEELPEAQACDSCGRLLRFLHCCVENGNTFGGVCHECAPTTNGAVQPRDPCAGGPCVSVLPPGVPCGGCGRVAKPRLNAYEQKQEERRARYEARAEKARDEADSAFGRARSIGDLIPLGQPILVGHHSEGRHRRDLQRIDDSMRRGVEATKRADYYEQKAAGVGTGGISSDDPDAIAKLEAELAQVEERQRQMKRVNAAHKAFLRDPSRLDASDLSEKVKALVRVYKPAYSWEPHPYAPYQLTNNSANARRIRERIKHLKAKAVRPAMAERVVGDVRVVKNVEANRLQLFFPGKPDDETRRKLKRYGFRWTPSLGCWQAFRSSRAMWAAGAILGVDLFKADAQGEPAAVEPAAGTTNEGESS